MNDMMALLYDFYCEEEILTGKVIVSFDIVKEYNGRSLFERKQIAQVLNALLGKREGEEKGGEIFALSP